MNHPFLNVAMALTIGLAWTVSARAAIPQPPAQNTLTPWMIPYQPDAPGVVSALPLLDKPAGKDGPVVARDGHFYTGDKRLKMFGVNFCFGGAFPTHDQADQIAHRLASLGVNAVRFHHMDSSPFPNGIFADASLETLSPEAIDRLDYFVAALKAVGVYSDINLHVSRDWAKTHKWPDAKELPGMGKMIDLFDPELIQAQKKYAHDLLLHPNPYTGNPFASEPAVAIIEIDNENSLFMWDSVETLAHLPEPHATMLRKLWNAWLMKKYGGRAKLAASWSQGVEPAGDNMLVDGDFATLGQQPSKWIAEQDVPAVKMDVTARKDGQTTLAVLQVTAVDDTDWHLQFNQRELNITKGKFYRVSFSARADQDVTVGLSVGQAHDPWENLGFATKVALSKELKTFHFGFTATNDEANARISFVVGRKPATIELGNITVAPGGQTTLNAGEDPANDSVTILAAGDPASAARAADWLRFLQATEQTFYSGMRDYLKNDLHVQAPVTGTIAFGAIGLLNQANMDYVDAHSYWDHPQFPHKQWDMRDWRINNMPLSDHPERSTMAGLAACRVAGKPFTVTEYNHADPNEWASECVPMLAATAALQDWDGVFLFAYTHDTNYQKDHSSGFFDIEGNPGKLAFMPLAYRMMVDGAIKPLPAVRRVGISADQVFAPGRNLPTPHDIFAARYEMSFEEVRSVAAANAAPQIDWQAQGSGSGSFAGSWDSAGVFTGFPKDNQVIALGPVKLEQIHTPFISALLTPMDPSKPDDYLLAMVGRTTNTDMQWDANRHTLTNRFGKAPALVETVSATLICPEGFAVYPIDDAGKAAEALPKTAGNRVDLSAAKAVWYRIAK